MAKPHWDRFEWDDENKKNGNVQHLRDHGIEPEEAVSSTTISLLRTLGDLMMSMSSTGRLTEEDACGWFSKTKAADSLEYSPAGT